MQTEKLDRRKNSLFVYGVGRVDWNSTYQVFNKSVNYDQISVEEIEKHGFTYHATEQDWFNLLIGKEVMVRSWQNTHRGILQSDRDGVYYINNADGFIEFSFSDVTESEFGRMTHIINLI